MKLSVDKADLGVPAGDRRVRVCERCEANISQELWTCPECGANLSDTNGVETMSTSFDSELARANLLRMRAEFRQAEDVCLRVLKRFPNSVAAHTLLGDIYSDQGLLEQSAQWYELALDLDPTSSSDRQKLDDVREQMKERDHISSIEQLGLPEVKAPEISKYGIATVIGLIILLSIVYAVRHGKIGGSSNPTVITTPIRATPDMNAAVAPTGNTNAKPSDSTTPVTSNNDDASATIGAPSEDRNLFQLIAQKSTVGTHLVSVLVDPRTRNATLTYTCAPDEDERKIGALLAKTALEQSAESTMVTIRSTKSDRLTYMADVPRTRFSETQTADWQQKATSPDAWIPYILTNEWPTKAPTDSGTTPATDSTAPATATSGTGDTTTNSATVDAFPDVPENHWATEKKGSKD